MGLCAIGLRSSGVPAQRDSGDASTRRRTTGASELGHQRPTVRGLHPTERRWNRTIRAEGCSALPVLKTGRTRRLRSRSFEAGRPHSFPSPLVTTCSRSARELDVSPWLLVTHLGAAPSASPSATPAAAPSTRAAHANVAPPTKPRSTLEELFPGAQYDGDHGHLNLVQATLVREL